MSAGAQPGPKQHHYVQRAYLEGFADRDFESRGECCLWTYVPGKSPFRQKPERIAKRNYYYCFDRENRRQFIFEHTLQKLEDISLPVLRKLRDHNFDIDPEERLTLAGYVALSYTRVPRFEGVVNRLAMLDTAFKMQEFTSVPENVKLLAREETEKTGKEVTPEELLNTLNAGSVYLTQTNRGWSLEQMIRIMMLLQRVIFDMRWSFLIADEEGSGFLTSDNPVAVFDAPTVDVPGTGFLSSPDTYFTFPISREICLMARHPPGSAQRVGRISAFGIRQVNKGTISRADTQLYAPFRSRRVQELHDAAVMARGTPKRIMVKRGKIVEE
jgi:Protein of unknown function (DUF4238)